MPDGVGAVDLGDHGGEHGWAGWHFGDLQGGTVAGGYLLQSRAQALCDVVAFFGADVFVGEVDLNVGDVGALPQKVVAHESVEVNRGGGSDVELHVADEGFFCEFGGEVAGDGGGAFEGGAFGGVDDDLELALVVVGEHFDLDGAHVDEGHRGEEHDDDACEHARAQPRLIDHRLDDFAVGAADGAGVVVVVASGVGGAPQADAETL